MQKPGLAALRQASLGLDVGDPVATPTPQVAADAEAVRGSRPKLMSLDAPALLERQLAGAEMLGDPAGLPEDWIDRFMQQILLKDYAEAREILRRAVSYGISQRVAEQYGGVLEDFLRRRDEIENPIILDRKGVCEVRMIDEATGRGLVVPKYTPWNGELYNERPLMYIQSPCSRKAVQVCLACLAPVGTLASQLEHLGCVVAPDVPDIRLCARPAGDAAAEELPGALGFQGFTPCCGGDPCRECFCSEACRDWALASSPHALLCRGRLSAERREALDKLEHLAEEAEAEHLLLLTHGIAAMLLERRRGVPLEEVLQRYARQFISRPWEDLELARLSKETPSSRLELLAKTLELLRRLYGGLVLGEGGEDLAEPLLDHDLLSGLMGTFELVNMCIALTHPLSAHGAQLAAAIGADELVRIAEIQAGAADVESDDEDDDGSEGEEGDDEAGIGAKPTAEEAVAACVSGELFANVLGTALVETLAFTNHSCLPNSRIDFATARDEGVQGPGLWVYCLARRPLMPGDEVTMSYVPAVTGRPLAVRQKKMEKFGFPCRCRSCVTDEMLAAEGIVIE